MSRLDDLDKKTQKLSLVITLIGSLAIVAIYGLLVAEITRAHREVQGLSVRIERLEQALHAHRTQEHGD